ncbi:MAG: hypothetical protein ACR2O8_09440, partial [Rhizobiaceae bacterium]
MVIISLMQLIGSRSRKLKATLKMPVENTASNRNLLVRFFVSLFFVLGVIIALSNRVAAQEKDAATAAAQANNPPANFKAVNVQNCYFGDISRTD